MTWQNTTLGEVIRLRRGHDLPAQSRISGDIPIVSSSGITGYHNVAKVNGPGVVTGRYGTLGEIHYVEGPYWPLNTALYVEDFKGNHPRYVAYLLSTLGLGERNAAGAVPGVNRNALHPLPVFIPSVDEQERIANILVRYDDLIENNQRRITLLEESARLLYREWFVNLRFPGHELMKMKDGVPDGWERVSLDTVASITMGQSPESKHYNSDGDGLPFHQGVTDFGHRFVLHEKFTRETTRTAEPGDILCSVRAPVGRLNVTLDQIAIGRGLSAMRSLTGHQSLLFYQLDDLFVEEDMIGGGAIFASVGKKELFGQKILQPDPKTADSFNSLAGDLDGQIEALERQTRYLREARDLLLPKLMSGEIQV